MIKIDFINHASVLITTSNIRLLCDPWFFGTCFADGWGLKYDNPEALKLAASATHLWISHFHSDHFHVPTLKKILDINPEIIAIGNNSYNFQLNDVMIGLGFKNVIPILERKQLNLNDEIAITRYPTTGIDNMLLIQTPYGNILNYNDCNLPFFARRQLSKKLPEIDLFLTNFNHAGKLLVYPSRSSEEIKIRLKQNFSNNFGRFRVKYILPFASYHYYRAPESFDQNSSLLNSDELLDIDDRILNFQIGDCLTYTLGGERPYIKKGIAMPNALTPLIRKNHTEFYNLQLESLSYCKNLKKNYWLFSLLLTEFYIEIVDLNIVAQLTVKKGLQLLSSGNQQRPHIKAHSSALSLWFKNPYGTDSFVVGAHFEICNENKIPLKWQIVFGLLIDNKLSVRSIVGMGFTLGGWKFLYNRKEEILGIFLERKISADYHD